jgi:uncharacterized membrane protein (UPF0127 family)
MSALIDVRTGQTVASQLELAVTRAARRRGLLGRHAIDKAAAIVLAPCLSIHTAFMGFAIDVVFVNADGRVVRVAKRVGPWRIVVALRAYAAIELAAGTVDACGVQAGDFLYVPSADAFASTAAACTPRSFRKMIEKAAADLTGNAASSRYGSARA